MHIPDLCERIDLGGNPFVGHQRVLSFFFNFNFSLERYGLYVRIIDIPEDRRVAHDLTLICETVYIEIRHNSLILFISHGALVIRSPF